MRKQLKQNELVVGDIIVKKTHLKDKVITVNDNIVAEFVNCYYILNGLMFFRDVTMKWFCYKKNKEGIYVKVYESKYMIITYPDLILDYTDGIFWLYRGFINTKNDVKVKCVLFSGDDFYINSTVVGVINSRQSLFFKYDLVNKKGIKMIVRKSSNKVETKKCVLYFDTGAGSIELYKKSRGRMESVAHIVSDVSYNIYTHLYIFKHEGDYLLYDIVSDKEIFRGSVISYIGDFVTIKNVKINKLLEINRVTNSIKTYRWDSYKVGDTKRCLQEYDYKKFL